MGLLLMAASAWLLFAVAISGAITVAYPSLRRRLAGLHPASRTWILRALAAGPLLLGGLGVALCFAPKLLGAYAPELDHCSAHTDGHAHFCFNHPPRFDAALDVWIGLGLLTLVASVLVALQARRARRSLLAFRPLLSTARFDAGRRAWIIDAEMPVAMAVGLRRPRTLLSTGLLDRLPARLVEAIVAHEHAHERRRDGLFRFATNLLSLGHWPRTRGLLRDDLELACEQACDEEAGATLGDRTRVAEALVAVERLLQGMPANLPGVFAFGAHDLSARVESLVGESAGRRWNGRATAMLLVATVTAAVLVADPLHHLTETLLHHLLG